MREWGLREECMREWGLRERGEGVGVEGERMR